MSWTGTERIEHSTSSKSLRRVGAYRQRERTGSGAAPETFGARSHLIDVYMDKTAYAPETTPSVSLEETNPALLSFERVTKEYDSDAQAVSALDDVSFRLGAAQFVAVVGRSGCGKSTLLNLAGAMDFPTRGDVRLEGVATGALSETQLTKLRREKVGFIFQSFQLLHTLSVVENVEVPLLLAGGRNPRSRAVEQLDAVGLAGLAHRMPHQLSGGQMQRVAIARALVHGPAILLADEPTGNLDSATGTSILQLLRRICDERKTAVLMATHSAEATAVVDSVMHMRDGRIVQS